tara:strand:+ start:5745 stop:6230 length:486 start_codon:yes stop_codon:yes gene_type:complete
MNNTLSKLFPKTEDYNKKIWKFLELSYSKGWSYRATAKELNIDHKTVKNILESVKDSSVYSTFMKKVEQTVQSFSDKQFKSTIFDRYERTLADLDNKIKECEDKEDTRNVVNYYKLKLAVLKDQLRASLAVQNTETQQIAIENAITTLQDEAWEEYGEKIQ